MTIQTTKDAITFITKNGYTIKDTLNKKISITKNNELVNIIKYDELINFAKYLEMENTQ